MTLLELIVVLAILTVIAGAAAPRLLAFSKGRRLREECRLFAATGRHARELAISQGAPVDLWVDLEANAYGVEPAVSWETDANAPAALSHELPEEVTIAWAGEGEAPAERVTVRYEPDGADSGAKDVAVEFRWRHGDRLTVSGDARFGTFSVKETPHVPFAN